jgi:phosphoglycolate phosphatase
MAIRGILFDKDGTLIASNGTWVPVYRSLLMDAFHGDIAFVEKQMILAGYNPETNGFIAGSIAAAGTLEQLIDVWWPEKTPAEKLEQVRIINRDYADEARKFLQPLMDLVPVFDELHELGMVLGVATNDINSSAVNHMQQIGVHDYFVEIIGADNVAVPKPSGQMIARFAEVTGLAPHEIAMVGDNSHDIDEARAGGAGMAIGVLTGNAAHEDIAHLADYTLNSVAEIPALLRSLA